jgi:hypothetical protein
MEIDDDESPPMRPEFKEIEREGMQTEEKPKSRRKPGPCPPPKSAAKNDGPDNNRKPVLMKEANNEE